jgi:hypothetical protein
MHKGGQYTLDYFAHQVTQLRLNSPQQDWHCTLDGIKSELVRMFQRSPESWLDMSEDKKLQYIYDFTTNLVNAYLTRARDEISIAVNKPETWREALDRVRRPFYHCQKDAYDASLLFICGCDQNIALGKEYIPRDAIIVRTFNCEWVLIASLFIGGSRTTVNTELLFPYKSSPSPNDSNQSH